MVKCGCCIPEPEDHAFEHCRTSGGQYAPHLESNNMPKKLSRAKFTHRATKESWERKYFGKCICVMKMATGMKNTIKNVGRLIYFYSLFIATCSCISTWICDKYDYRGKMPWSFVSIAIIFPITFAIGNSVGRRDQALQQFAQMRSAAFGLFIGFKAWGGKERCKERTHEALYGRTLLYDYLDAVVYFFEHPNSENSRNLPRIYDAVTALGEGVEDLRTPPASVNAGQIHRLQQYVYLMHTCFEKMKHLKEYRTPPPLRAFAYLTILVFPVLFGVEFAYIAEKVTLTFAMITAAITSFVMTGLMNVSDHAESLFDYSDKVNEFIDVRYPVAEIKVAMKVAGDDENGETVDLLVKEKD